MNLGQLIMVCGVSVFALGLGAVILQRNPRSTSHRLFLLMCVVLSLWMVLSFMSDQSRFVSHAIRLNRAAFSFGMLVCLVVFLLALVFPRSRTQLTWPWAALLAPIPVFALIAYYTPWVVSMVTIEPWGTNQVMGPFATVIGIWLPIVLVFVAVRIARQYRDSTEFQRTQYKYFYIGLGLFGMLTSVIAGLVPVVFHSNILARYEPVAILALICPTAYAIARHRLMDVTYVAVRAAAITVVVAAVGAFVIAFAYVGADDLSKFIGLDPRLWVFFAALVAILGMQPFQQAVAGIADRVYYRRTYDPNHLLGEMNLVIASSFNVEGLAGYIVTELMDVMRLTFASIIYLDEDALRMVSTERAFSDEERRRFFELQEGRTVLFSDDLDPHSEDGLLLSEHCIRAVVPLSIENNRIGALLLGPKANGSIYSVQDGRFLHVLAAEVSIALRNVQLFEEKNRRVRELVALNELAIALGEDTGLEAMLHSALTKAAEVSHGDTGSIMLLGDDGTLTVAAAIGLARELVESASVQLGEGLADRVARTRHARIVTPDSPEYGDQLDRYGIRTSIVAPVLHKDQILGVLNVGRIENPEPFSEESLRVLTGFAGQIGAAVANARLYQDLEATFFGTISALAAAVDAKDPYTFGHSNEVTEHAVAIAERLKLPENEVHTIRIASTLHDIGKIGIDSAILHKPGQLDNAERSIIEEHPRIGADILAPLEFLQEAVPLVLFHHERYGGGGYPSGVSGQAIPLGARIISVADSFNAMTSDRPYRTGLPVDEAVRELHDNAGTQFDPEVVEVFLQVLEEERASLVAH